MKFMVLFLMLILNTAFAENNYSTKSKWLMETNSSEEKFKKIEKQLRGFDLAMVEVGYRFNSFYFALQDKNYPLAEYQLDKIKKAIENGIERRPKREKNSKIMFLDTQYENMKIALKKEDEILLLQEYNSTKQSCNACHIAERVPFIHVIDPKYRWQPIK